jgi:hypothetical protein
VSRGRGGRARVRVAYRGFGGPGDDTATGREGAGQVCGARCLLVGNGNIELLNLVRLVPLEQLSFALLLCCLLSSLLGFICVFLRLLSGLLGLLSSLLSLICVFLGLVCALLNLL